MTLTSPRRTRKYDDILLSDESVDSFEAVTSQPENLARDTIDFGVVLGTFHRLGIFFNSKDAFPTSRARKSDCVAADTRECIDNNGFVLGR